MPSTSTPPTPSTRPPACAAGASGSSFDDPTGRAPFGTQDYLGALAFDPVGLGAAAGEPLDYLADDYLDPGLADPGTSAFGGPLRSMETNLEAELPPGDYSTFRQRKATASGFSPDVNNMSRVVDPHAWVLNDEQEALRWVAGGVAGVWVSGV